jgi:F0F1-type ATP synthase delta subunit
MAELATIARPYAEALFKAARQCDAAGLKGRWRLAEVAATPELRQL